MIEKILKEDLLIDIPEIINNRKSKNIIYYYICLIWHAL